MKRTITGMRIAACLLLATVLNITAVRGLECKQEKDKCLMDTGRLVVELVKSRSGSISLGYRSGGRITVAARVSVRGKSGLLPLIGYKVGKQEKRSLTIAADFGETGTLSLLARDGSEYVEISPQHSGVRLVVEFDSEVLVIPDRVAIDAHVLRPDDVQGRVVMPSDNHLFMNLLRGEDAMLTCLWNDPKAGIAVRKSGCFSGFSYAGRAGGKLWLGLQAAKGIWHCVNEKLNNIKPARIDWVRPFSARWHVVLKRERGEYKEKYPEADGLCDTWPVPRKGIKKKDVIFPGVGIIKIETWHAWSAGISGFTYPCFFKDKAFFLQYPKFQAEPKLRYQENFKPIVYPVSPWSKWHRLPSAKNVPLCGGFTLPFAAADKFLGKEILAYTTCVRAQDDRYPATCGVTHKVEKIFYHEKEKEKAEYIYKELKRMDQFIVHVRKRLEAYMTWQREFDKWLAQQVSANPACADMITKYRKILSRLQWHYAARVEKMKTPDYARTLINKLAKVVPMDMDEEEKEKRCKDLGRQIRQIGGSQDSTLGRARQTTRYLRRLATLRILMGATPKELPILMKIRAETAKIMHFRFGMEGK